MKHPKPNTPSPDSLGVLPTLPRFTLETLRAIRMATGDAESTIAAYAYTHGGTTATKYARFEDLSHAEREAALLFILRYGKAGEIRRKGKPRGRAAAGKPRTKPTPPPLDIADLAPVDLDSIEPPTLPELTGEGIPQYAGEKVLPPPKKPTPHRKQ